MTATLTRLSPPQQRLVNTVFDYGANRVHRRADQLLAGLQAEWDDLVGVVDQRLIEARNERGGAVTNLATLPSLPFKGPNVWPLWLYLTNVGRDWVLTDPLNALLRYVNVCPARRVRLDHAVAVGGRKSVRNAADGGYLTLHEVESQREVRLTDRSVRDFVFGRAQHFTVNGTRKIAQVLG
jgi:hypothetical protein